MEKIKKISLEYLEGQINGISFDPKEINYLIIRESQIRYMSKDSHAVRPIDELGVDLANEFIRLANTKIETKEFKKSVTPALGR